MEQNEFEREVLAAVAAVPSRFREKLHNVAIVVEERVRHPHRREEPIIERGLLLGLYQGIPYGSRGPWYSGVLPDKITIFKSAIEALAGSDPEAIRRQIRQTIWHEIGHYFGMSEAEVRRWERRRAQRTK